MNELDVGGCWLCFKIRTQHLFEGSRGYYKNLTFMWSRIVIYFYSNTNQMHQFLKFILFCSSTLHVSDGLSVGHQESKTVHTASGIYHRGSVAAC